MVKFSGREWCRATILSPSLQQISLPPHPRRFSPSPPYSRGAKSLSSHLTVIRSRVHSSALYRDTCVYWRLSSNLVIQCVDYRAIMGTVTTVLSPTHSLLPRHHHDSKPITAVKPQFCPHYRRKIPHVTLYFQVCSCCICSKWLLAN